MRIEQIMEPRMERVRRCYQGRAKSLTLSAGTGSAGTDRSQGWELMWATMPDGQAVRLVIGDKPGIKPTGHAIKHQADYPSEAAVLAAIPEIMERLAQELFAAHNASGMPGCQKPQPWTYSSQGWS